MSAGLSIPGEAAKAAVDAVRALDADDEPGAREYASAAITAAAPLIVAAELERMADLLIGYPARVLYARAEELRGEQS